MEPSARKPKKSGRYKSRYYPEPGFEDCEADKEPTAREKRLAEQEKRIHRELAKLAKTREKLSREEIIWRQEFGAESLKGKPRGWRKRLRGVSNRSKVSAVVRNAGTREKGNGGPA